jgi:glycosyltransferase involved in cell wall biosynthesis
MRILHFTNIPLNVEQIRSGGEGLNTSGGWMAALLGQMLKTTDNQFACVAFGNVQRIQITRGERVESFVLPQSSETRGLKMCRDIVEQWNPDLIHIHGTESAFGLLTACGIVKCPTVISLQGLLGSSSEWYRYFGNLSLLNVIRMHRFLELPTFRGHWMGFRKIRKAAKREEKIIKGNQAFIGRTNWGQAYIRALNPSAQYFHGGELLRPAFWKERWELEKVQRYRVIFTNAGHPRKGAEVLLEAVSLLRSDYPNIQVCIAGGISHRSGYGRYLRKRINALNGAAMELGQLDAEQMVAELTKSHVFVSPSYIDNSPNAVCEAQLLGLPVVSTYTGGIPSLIDEGRTGLFFPTGDAPMLAARLRDVFEDDSLAARLSEQGNSAAKLRHDPEVVVNQILSVYNTLVGESE